MPEASPEIARLEAVLLSLLEVDPTLVTVLIAINHCFV
jgi:hypothetical protein